METTRREFLKESLSALGFLALPGGWLFASPPGWKPKGKPNLVFGVISDTHLRTAVNGNRHGAHWPDKYFAAALRYFKEQEVDAVVHCGDMAHRGQTREMEFHAEAWKRVFGGVENGPVKLFVTGNHDVDGSGYGGFVKKRYPDPAERAKYVLATDMAANWGRIWGEKYEPVWHKEVKGYHFIGRNWGASLQDIAEGLKTLPGESRAPVFYIQHRRPLAASRKIVASNFLGDNPGFNAIKGESAKCVGTYSLGDVEIRTSLIDHFDAAWGIDFTMAYEIKIGNFILYHTGDSGRGTVPKLNTVWGQPDLWLFFPGCGINVADAVRKVNAKRIVFGHLWELGHAESGRLNEPRIRRALAAAKPICNDTSVAFWGDRII